MMIGNEQVFRTIKECIYETIIYYKRNVFSTKY